MNAKTIDVIECIIEHVAPLFTISWLHGSVLTVAEFYAVLLKGSCTLSSSLLNIFINITLTIIAFQEG